MPLLLAKKEYYKFTFYSHIYRPQRIYFLLGTFWFHVFPILNPKLFPWLSMKIRDKNAELHRCVRY